jgi:hypothetical protein
VRPTSYRLPEEEDEDESNPPDEDDESDESNPPEEELDDWLPPRTGGVGLAGLTPGAVGAPGAVGTVGAPTPGAAVPMWVCAEATRMPITVMPARASDTTAIASDETPSLLPGMSLLRMRLPGRKLQRPGREVSQ